VKREPLTLFLTLFPSLREQMEYIIEFVLKSTFQKYILLYRLYPFTSCTLLVSLTFFCSDYAYCNSDEKRFFTECEQQKCSKKDCINQYFAPYLISKNQILINKKSSKPLNPNETIGLELVASDKPVIIYKHQSQQKLVEFICYIASISTLWFEFSIFSIYSYSKLIGHLIMKII
jgi:hypothetical protein